MNRNFMDLNVCLFAWFKKTVNSIYLVRNQETEECLERGQLNSTMISVYKL